METDLQATKKCHRKKIVTQENVCISSRKLKENHIGVLKVWSLTYNDSNFNMIINCEILKHPTESFTKCQICIEIST